VLPGVISSKLLSFFNKTSERASPASSDLLGEAKSRARYLHSAVDLRNQRETCSGCESRLTEAGRKSLMPEDARKRGPFDRELAGDATRRGRSSSLVVAAREEP